MGKYGHAALIASFYYLYGHVNTPEKAWESATIIVFGQGTSSQLKGCPRAAFLGLCEDGLIKGIPQGKYTKSKDNKSYAIKAVQELKKNPSNCNNPDGLWQIVAGNKAKNNQIDVVLTLWINGLML